MNKELLNKAINKYKEQKKNDINLDAINERKKRKSYYQSWTKEKINAMTEDEFIEYIGKLWATNRRKNKKDFGEFIIEKNNGLSNLKKYLINLLYGEDDIALRWDDFRNNIIHLGEAAMSELLCLVNPKEYIIFNDVTRRCYDYLQVKNNTKVDGKKYKEICEISKEILCKFETPTEDVDLLYLDYIFWDCIIPLSKLDIKLPQLNNNLAKKEFFSKEFFTKEFTSFVLKQFLFEDCSYKKIEENYKIMSGITKGWCASSIISFYKLNTNNENNKNINKGLYKGKNIEKVANFLLSQKDKNYVKIGNALLEQETNVSIKDDKIESYDRISGGLNKIFYGAPGCGKSFHITKTFCTEDNIYFRTTFHPDYTNGDFIGQIIPKLKDNQVFYDIQEGPFSKALAEAIKNPDKKVCLIIEEINRGNASAIFGDVFQLLDRDKTGKSIFEINNYIIQEYLRREEITEIDGQKIDKIFIPSNLWILATMNTSDQNVFTLDTAFKRRWQLEKIKNIFKFEDKYENEADVEYDKKLAAMLVPGTDWTWKKFVYWINDNIVKKDTFSVNGEDKQIGVYFVKEDELWESTSEMDDKEERKKRFAEKVLMYLWEDVTRLNRDSWFGNEYRTLDQLINAFNDSKIRLNIFKDIAVENSTIVATNSESSDENE